MSPEEAKAYWTRRDAEFKELVYPNQATLLKIAYKLLKSRADAEDVVEDAMLAVWDKDVVAACNRDPKRILGYMVRVVSRKSLNFLRESANRDGALARVADFFHLRKRKWAESLDIAVALEGLDTLSDILDELPKECAEAYRLVDIEGATYEQAAEELNTNTNTFKARLTKARKYVRARLAERGSDLGPGGAGEEKEDTP